MEKKKSSIDWLFIRLFELFDQYERGKISRWTLGELMVTKTEQAKAMHKEEVTDAYIECWMNDGGNGFHKVKEAEQYYNETFGGENEQ